MTRAVIGSLALAAILLVLAASGALFVAIRTIRPLLSAFQCIQERWHHALPLQHVTGRMGAFSFSAPLPHRPAAPDDI